VALFTRCAAGVPPRVTTATTDDENASAGAVLKGLRSRRPRVAVGERRGLAADGMTTQTFTGTNADRTSTTVTDAALQAGPRKAPTFKVDQDDLLAGGSVLGNGGSDTLIVVDNTFDLTSTTLSSIERLQTGNAGGTTFTVDQQAALGSNGNWAASTSP